jgi:MFS family permease
VPWPRTALAWGLALAYSLALLGDQMLYVVLPTDPAAAGIAAASLGVILSANRVVRLAANSLGGALSDRLGRRRPYLLGMVLAFASTAGYLAADGFWSLLAWRLVWGIAFALISVGGTAIVLDLSSPGDRGRAVGTYQSLLQAGAGPARTLSALRRLDPHLLVPAYVSFASRFTHSGVLTATLGAYLTQLAPEAGSGGFAIPVASLTGSLLAAWRLIGMVEAPIAGRLLDRFGDRRLIAAAGVAVSLGGFSVLATGHGVSAVLAGVALVAIGEGFLHPAVVVWTGDGTPPSLRGIVMGGLATAGDLGAALGPLVGYALLAGVGLGPAYGLCAALLLSALAALAVFRPPS